MPEMAGGRVDHTFPPPKATTRMSWTSWSVAKSCAGHRWWWWYRSRCCKTRSLSNSFTFNAPISTQRKINYKIWKELREVTRRYRGEICAPKRSTPAAKTDQISTAAGVLPSPKADEGRCLSPHPCTQITLSLQSRTLLIGINIYCWPCMQITMRSSRLHAMQQM